MRALPQYERGFREHLAEADALAAAGRQRLGAAVRLANEMEVQARPRLMINETLNQNLYWPGGSAWAPPCAWPTRCRSRCVPA